MILQRLDTDEGVEHFLVLIDRLRRNRMERRTRGCIQKVLLPALKPFSCKKFVPPLSHSKTRIAKLVEMDEPRRKRARPPKPVSVNLSNTNYPIVRTCAEEMGYAVTDSTRKAVLFWCDQAASSEFMSRLLPWQMYNHFPGMWAIARKVDMIRSLERLQRLCPEIYNFWPKSFIVPGNYQDFRSYMDRHYARKTTRKTFVVKPDRGSLGRGIILIQDAESIASYMDLAIAQKYISPFLVDGLKFDLRIYALVTSADPLRIYIHNEGMARFCTEPYEDPNPGNLENVFSHLTNYSLNKKNENFDADNSKGHKRPMSTIFREVEARGFDLVALKHRIDEIIRLTITSIQPFLSNNYKATVSVNDGKSRCFELLGFDILLDQQARPWLLEVNFMPMLDVDTHFDGELKSSVLKGVFTILGLSPTFKRHVLKRQRAETEKRINGATALSIPQIFDPAVESQAAAERTNWRQLYPLISPDVSDIETALFQVKTLTMASIENGAFRARQRAVLTQLQEIREREAVHQWRPVPLKVYVAPPALIPRRKARSPSPVERSPIVPIEPIDPPAPVERALPIPTRRLSAGRADFPFFAVFAAAPPQTILAREESVRQAALARQAAEEAITGVERAVLDFFRMGSRVQQPARASHSLLKIRQSLVAKPVVKLPVAIHHFA
jgi:tubulin polyglutamylase TTLL6/13